MEKKYRITFHDGPTGNRRKDVDVIARGTDDAFRQAFQMPEAKNRLYSEVIVAEIPKEPSVIGVEFAYRDTALKRDFVDYMFIKARDEAEAVRCYNEHFLGSRFWFRAGKTEEDGKCVRGKVLQTYFAVGARYDADATVLDKGKVDALLEDASSRCITVDHLNKSVELGKD